MGVLLGEWAVLGPTSVPEFVADCAAAPPDTIVKRNPMTGPKHRSKLDKAVDMTFPASDPTATAGATGTEPSRRPVDRKPPVITREQIEAAESDEGHRHLEKRSRVRREKHHGLGENGLHETDKAEPTVVKGHAGLGNAGKRRSK